MQNPEVVKGELEKNMIKNRYLIGRHLDSGSNGMIYKIVDNQNQKVPLVIKLSEDCMAFSQEINHTKKIYKSGAKNCSGISQTPQVVDYGLINQIKHGKETLLAYMIIPRYGHNLDTFFTKQNQHLNRQSILDLGLRIISMLQRCHEAGLVYNDLKLDNILFGYNTKFPRTLGES